ncbi:GDSL esterase lipase 7-like, partial [Olea europaea subsp. europaea]
MLVSEYNTWLEEKIVALNAELSGAHIIFCDVYRAIMEFVNNPQNYGVKDVHNRVGPVERNS